MNYAQWKANVKQNRPNERLGQAFVNDFIKCQWPELFYSESDDKSEELIMLFLTDCQWWPNVPQKVVKL